MNDTNRKEVGDLLSDPETTATTLLVIALRAYGEEVFGNEETGIPPMDPVELWIRLEEDFNAKVHENCENKLNALMTALASDAFYENIQVFVAVASALEDGDLGDLVEGQMEPLTVPEMLWAIYEVELNRDDEQDFSPAIVDFMDKTMNEEADEIDETDQNPMSYWERFLADKREQMFQELRIVGIEESMIRKLRIQDLTPAHDTQGEYTPEGI
jgi:hypothetical protein